MESSASMILIIEKEDWACTQLNFFTASSSKAYPWKEEGEFISG
jgi:hypothetical protein